MSKIGHLASNVLGPSTNIKISLFLLSIYTDELMSTRKVITLLSILPTVNENPERESNPKP